MHINVKAIPKHCDAIDLSKLSYWYETSTMVNSVDYIINCHNPSGQLAFIYTYVVDYVVSYHIIESFNFLKHC